LGFLQPQKILFGGPGATIDNSSGNRSRDKNRDTSTDTNKNTGTKQDVAKQKEAQQNKPSGFLTNTSEKKAFLIMFHLNHVGYFHVLIIHCTM